MTGARAGLFLTFEGIEGCGKSTQLARLAGALRDRSIPHSTTKEPGGTSIGRRIRSILLSPDSGGLVAGAELLLYTADRLQHLEEIVEPRLARGEIVLCDRYLDATLAYQGYGRGIPIERITALHREPPLRRRPDRTVLLDLDVDTALGRARQRNATRDLDGEGRFEAEDVAFHRRVREGYLSLSRQEPDRFRVVDGAGSAEGVHRRVVRALADLIPALGERAPS